MKSQWMRFRVVSFHNVLLMRCTIASNSSALHSWRYVCLKCFVLTDSHGREAAFLSTPRCTLWHDPRVWIALRDYLSRLGALRICPTAKRPDRFPKSVSSIYAVGIQRYAPACRERLVRRVLGAARDCFRHRLAGSVCGGERSLPRDV